MCILETLPVQSTAAAPVQEPCFVVVFTTLSCRTSFSFTTWQQRTLAEVNFRSAYHSAYLREGTGIGEQYYIYCSPIPILQIGIGFEGLRGGHKKCPAFNRTHVARVAIGPFTLSGLCGRDVTRLQLETRYIKSPDIGLYNRC